MPKALLTDKSNYQMKEASVILTATQHPARHLLIAYLEEFGNMPSNELRALLKLSIRDMKKHTGVLEMAQVISLQLGVVSLNTGRLLQLTQFADNIVNY